GWQATMPPSAARGSRIAPRTLPEPSRGGFEGPAHSCVTFSLSGRWPETGTRGVEAGRRPHRASKDIAMKRLVIASALILAPFALAATAEAQGTIPGAQRGAEDGNRAAGPIGGVVGGAVGAATGTVGGVLGVDPERDRREDRMERREMQRR